MRVSVSGDDMPRQPLASLGKPAAVGAVRRVRRAAGSRTSSTHFFEPETSRTSVRRRSAEGPAASRLMPSYRDLGRQGVGAPDIDPFDAYRRFGRVTRRARPFPVS